MADCNTSDGSNLSDRDRKIFIYFYLSGNLSTNQLYLSHLHRLEIKNMS
ncbi:MAG: hypothetical protein ACFB2X_11305 [Rivularia sp. (in: cyanobacteria)]